MQKVKSLSNCKNLVISLTSSQTLMYVKFVWFFVAHHLVITTSTSDDGISKMALSPTSPPPVNQASFLLIRWHSLPCQRTFHKTISSREESIWALKRAINSNQALLWRGEWSSPRVSVILWLYTSYAKLPFSAFVLHEQYEPVESVLGPLGWQVHFW